MELLAVTDLLKTVAFAGASLFERHFLNEPKRVVGGFFVTAPTGSSKCHGAANGPIINAPMQCSIKTTQ